MAQLLIPVFTKGFKKKFSKLSPLFQKRFNAKLTILVENPRHPSLRTRKMSGSGVFEARITIHDRFTYQVVNNEVWLLTIGPHDEGLGKK